MPKSKPKWIKQKSWTEGHKANPYKQHTGMQCFASFRRVFSSLAPLTFSFSLDFHRTASKPLRISYLECMCFKFTGIWFIIYLLLLIKCIFIFSFPPSLSHVECSLIPGLFPFFFRNSPSFSPFDSFPPFLFPILFPMSNIHLFMVFPLFKLPWRIAMPC